MIFGSKNGFDTNLDVLSLNGSNGFIINGSNSRDRLGNTVSSAGDVNGDGIGDVIISSPFASPDGKTYAGTSYVLFGSRTDFPARVDVSTIDDSGIGLVINGSLGERAGLSVSNAGDVNGDKIDDLIIGARGVDFGSYSIISSGRSYVVYGESSVSHTPDGLIDLINNLPPEALEEQLVNTLVQKISNSQEQADKESICAAVNILGAFQNEVEAQRGKKIEDATATLLIDYSINLVEQLLLTLPEGEECK